MVSTLDVVGTVLTAAGVSVPGLGLFSSSQISAWRASLQPASWRGVPFFVESSEMQAGRNTAVHPYAFRETNPVWVEDVGLAATSTRIVGFLVGDNVAQQQNAMLAAVQVRGPGALVHPMRGSLTGSMVGGCRFSLRKDRGRYIALAFEFLEGSDFDPYPGFVQADQGTVGPDASPDDPAALQQSYNDFFAQHQEYAGQAAQLQQSYADSVASSPAGVSAYVDSTAPVGVNPSAGVPTTEGYYANGPPVDLTNQAYVAYRMEGMARSSAVQKRYHDSALGLT